MRSRRLAVAKNSNTEKRRRKQQWMAPQCVMLTRAAKKNAPGLASAAGVNIADVKQPAVHILSEESALKARSEKRESSREMITRPYLQPAGFPSPESADLRSA